MAKLKPRLSLTGGVLRLKWSYSPNPLSYLCTRK